MATNESSEPNKLALAAGFGIGVMWIVMALWCLKSAVDGFSDSREDYGLVWAIVGALLLGAGIAAVVATYWHQFVLKRRYAAHH